MYRLRTLVVSALLATPLLAHAAYPDKPIKVVVPAAPGTTSDLLLRVLSAQLSKQLGVPLVIDNRPGASFLIGTMAIVRAPADGYTIGYGNVTTFSINPALLRSMPYAPSKDLTPISEILQVRNLLVVPNQSRFHSVKDVVAYAKEHPGKLSVASGGNGTTGHLGGELFKSMTSINMVHVPYKSGAQAAQDLIGGQADLMFENISIVGPLVEGGKLRALAYAGPTRSKKFPSVPTIQESGVPNYDMSAWGGLIGPANMPTEIVNRLDAEIRKAMLEPQVKARFEQLGVDVDYRDTAAFRKLIETDAPKWKDVVKASGATVD
ncbi:MULTISPECIES: tripartite tricarboxylate transporter substrate binding protein [unclassified Cupriavidus]|uniref:Bug family tripartite tricarboxylate transporter substrate binding protein n=1 Tax=unclassified Cupriavidus TaxID=2640874 RepID=UPI001C001BD4|nr:MULTISPECIES: tripartite tricarboxylate transporter substrate binding protein [unclassified Cupriavidus]MCA3187692.1 tripartite tricarboxylate transporter substrate binding protein [Cupriavidus sp.]MCA3189117.1 tripartite tricarboxylate transporter substrate binding protein [Cupriavidus sp.]MCA3198837.1 tripartite tricarboxylate transporter substrate binding protein [Cupriavidus sp.]MCA3201581.1 tripartite tricarboxylate transporter substrate binding protein [Cupriavidus sp.]MCA3230872.1 tr